MRKKNYNKRGSAILIALLVMSVLLVVALGVGEIIVKEIRVQNNEVQRLKAFYTAESGMEKALLDIYEHNVPGYTKPQAILTDLKSGSDLKTVLQNKEDRLFTQKENLNFLFANDQAVYKYQILGQDFSVPCFVDSEKKEDHYGSLDRNESLTVPLHKYIGEDASNNVLTEEIANFAVDYYVVSPNILPSSIVEILTKNDVLRWKIFGLNKDQSKLLSAEETDAITDYFPLNSMENTAERPSRFASAADLLDKSLSIWAKAKYYKWRNSLIGYLIFPDYPIDLFIKEHTHNYLMLTNILGGQVDLFGGRNGAVFRKVTANDPNYDPAYDKLVSNRILKYRLSADKGLFSKGKGLDLFACDRYFIRSDGEYRTAKQSIDMEIALETFLPVFDFALYEVASEK